MDWSDRCQYFAPMWEEVHNRLQGTINMGRVNLGRDKGASCTCVRVCGSWARHFSCSCARTRLD